MSINLANLESVIAEKLENISSPSEAQTLSKALKQIKNGTIYSVSSYTDLPAVTGNDGKLYYVTDEETLYFAYNKAPMSTWISFYPPSINSLFHSGDVCYMGVSCTAPRYSCTWVQSSLTCTNFCHVTHWGLYGGAAITTDNKLFAWGDSAYGKLGSYTCPPPQVCPDCYFTDVHGGYYQSLVIRDDGTLWGSGLNACGTLGRYEGATCLSQTSLIQEFHSATNWVEVKTVENLTRTTAARKTDGTLWFWGLNDSGQRGDGTVLICGTPIQEISSSTTWTSVMIGNQHMNAVKSDGTVWGSGQGTYAGMGVSTHYSSPVQEVCNATNWCKVSGRFQHTIALKTDGTMWGWGRNNAGQLGTGNSSFCCWPTQEITSSTNWCFICSGCANNGGIKTDGSLWVWGQLQHGAGLPAACYVADSSPNMSSPVQEYSSGTWSFAAASVSCRMAAITGISL